MGMRVLVVEDNEAVRRAVVRACRWAGHAVVALADVVAGCVQLDEAAFDVVLADYGLPGGERGTAVLAHAQRVQPLAWRALMAGDPPANLVVDGS